VTEDRLAVGLVRGVHGLRGAVRVEVLSDHATRFEAGSVLHAEGSELPLTIVSAQPDGPGLLVRFREVPDRRTADGLREKYLEVPAAASELPPDSYYWHQIIGCSVQTESGEALGTVKDVFRAGDSEVYVVHGPRGELLVPSVTAVVRELDPAGRRIVVDAAALGLEVEQE
jgi:16S rRNA processing protein RimM